MVKVRVKTRTDLLPATSGPVISLPTLFSWPGFRTPSRFLIISSTWKLLRCFVSVATDLRIENTGSLFGVVWYAVEYQVVSFVLLKVCDLFADLADHINQTSGIGLEYGHLVVLPGQAFFHLEE